MNRPSPEYSLSHQKAAQSQINARGNNESPAEVRAKTLKIAVKFFKDNLSKVESFKGLPEYSDRVVEKDAFSAQKLAAEYGDFGQDMAKQWSIVQEAIILSEAELSDWFGDTTRTIKPTDHADYVQGIDGILELANNEKIAFDATFSNNPQAKIHKNREFIDRGALHPITYFEDDETGFKGKIKVPKIVLGFGKDNLLSVARDWLALKQGIEGSKTKLAESPVQMLLIYQALIQFSAIELYARNILRDNEQADKYKELGQQMLEVYNKKITDNPTFKDYELDDFTNNLVDSVRREYGLKFDDIKNNIWPPKPIAGKVIKLPRKPLDEQVKRAAA